MNEDRLELNYHVLHTLAKIYQILGTTPAFSAVKFISVINIEMEKTTGSPFLTQRPNRRTPITSTLIELEYRQFIATVNRSSHETLNIIDTVIENILNYTQSNYIIK
jgi:hypothetical protein